ncbi:MAG: hypothetical protein JWN38_376 [Candidatus Saccharibacteria bacterium]|nr:hypothetical protein [Candidatus Saccharibacteria bacterium]
MTATNHAITGALIGLAVGNPWLAVPLAVASHFACDAIPHFAKGADTITSKWFVKLLAVEALLCFLLVVFLAVNRPEHWWVGAVCAFSAAAPDFMWINKFRRARKGQDFITNRNWLLRFHGRIQWFERPIGAVVEVVWAAAGLTLLTLIVV